MDPLSVFIIFLAASAGFVQCNPITNPQQSPVLGSTTNNGSVDDCRFLRSCSNCNYCSCNRYVDPCGNGNSTNCGCVALGQPHDSASLVNKLIFQLLQRILMVGTAGQQLPGLVGLLGGGDPDRNPSGLIGLLGGGDPGNSGDPGRNNATFTALRSLLNLLASGDPGSSGLLRQLFQAVEGLLFGTAVQQLPPGMAGLLGGGDPGNLGDPGRNPSGLVGLLGGGDPGNSGDPSRNNATFTALRSLLNLLASGDPGSSGLLRQLLQAVLVLLSGTTGNQTPSPGLADELLKVLNQLLQLNRGGCGSVEPGQSCGNWNSCGGNCCNKCCPGDPQDICHPWGKTDAEMLQECRANENDLKDLACFLERCGGANPDDNNCCGNTCDTLRRVLALILKSGKEINKCFLNELMYILREYGENCKSNYPCTQQEVSQGSNYMPPSNQLTLVPPMRRLPNPQVCQVCTPRGIIYRCPSLSTCDGFMTRNCK